MNKFLIFDLDGVLIDSKKNMEFSWSKVNRSLKYEIKFENYFKNIGKPFEEILKLLGVKKDISKAKKIFRDNSIKKFNLIKSYPYVKFTLEKLRKKGYKLGLITSKESSRTYKLLKKFKFDFKYVQCPIIGKKGKPYPYLLNKMIKKSGNKKKDTFYIGDTHTDYLFAKNSNINFIFCKYGYGSLKIKSVIKIKKIKELLSIFC